MRVAIVAAILGGVLLSAMSAEACDRCRRRMARLGMRTGNAGVQTPGTGTGMFEEQAKKKVEGTNNGGGPGPSATIESGAEGTGTVSGAVAVPHYFMQSILNRLDAIETHLKYHGAGADPHDADTDAENAEKPEPPLDASLSSRDVVARIELKVLSTEVALTRAEARRMADEIDRDLSAAKLARVGTKVTPVGRQAAK